MIRTALLATAALLLAPTAAHAAPATTIAVGGAAAKSLRSQGVRTLAIPPARTSLTTWTLPVSSAGATTRHLGGVILQTRQGPTIRRLVLTGMQLRTTGRPVLTTLLAGRRITLLRFASARLGAATLSAEAAQIIRRRLHLRTTPTGRLGLLSTTPAPAGTTTPATQPTTQTTPPQTTPVPVPQSPVSPGGGDDTPRTCPAPGAAPAGAPPLPARPASAVNVTAAAITWHVRDSFTDYINTGEGTSTADGATAAAPSGTPALHREFSFPVRDGWVDAGSGTAALRFSGCVRFAYSGHGIQIDAQDPEIEIAGGASRAIFRFSGSSTTPGRAVLANLAPTPPTLSNGGQTHTWTQLAGSIPAGAATSVFAGFYFPGDPFGWFTVSATT